MKSVIKSLSFILLVVCTVLLVGCGSQELNFGKNCYGQISPYKPTKVLPAG